MSRRPVSPGRIAAVAIAGLALLLPTTASAQSFLRADANDDGKVSVADSVYVYRFLFLGQAAPPCLGAADSNDDGKIDLADSVFIFNAQVLGGTAIPAPAGGAGEDPTPDELTCDSWTGTVPPLEEATAEISLSIEAHPSGDADRRVATVYASTSAPIAALEAHFTVDGIGQALGAEDLAQVARNSGVGALAADGVLSVGWLASFVNPGALGPGDDIPVMTFDICLAEGATAGTYDVLPIGGELVHDVARLPIVTEVLPSSFDIAADLAVGEGCAPLSGPGDPGELPERPDDIVAEFRIGDGAGAPGGSVTVPFVIESNASTQGFSISVDFDEEILEATDVRQIFETPYEWGFYTFDLSNGNETPGNAGVDEGFLVAAAVMSFEHHHNNLPAGESVETLGLDFTILPSAPVGSTAIRFLDGGQGSGQPIPNSMTAFGEIIEPSVAKSFLFVNGIMEVVADVTLFIRGDANGDAAIDVSDAQFTLGYLFLGASPPPCLDAADSNDDGHVDISDPLATLAWLFRGGPELPAPITEPGSDPTADGLGCAPAL